MDAVYGFRLAGCGVPANPRAGDSLFWAPLGHMGPRGGLDLSSPSALIKVNYLVIRHLHFESVLGDLQEGNGCASRCQLPLSLVPIPTFRAQNWGFCALLPVSFSRWWFLGAPSRAQKKSGTKKSVHKENCARRRVCSRRESNPYGHFCPQDFKSCVSTYSTTRAVQI